MRGILFVHADLEILHEADEVEYPLVCVNRHLPEFSLGELVKVLPV